MKTSASPKVGRFEHDDVIIEGPPPAARPDALDPSSGIVTGVLTGIALWLGLIIFAILIFR